MLDERIQPFKQRGWLRWIMRRLIHLAFSILTRLAIIGEENIPQDGRPLLVIGNHFGFIDPVLMIRVIQRPIEFLGGVTLPNAPQYVTWIPRLWGYLPVFRGSLSRETLNTATQWLKQGGVLGVFPEGGSWAQVLRPPRWGAAYLAVRSGATVLPIGIDGLTEVFPSLWKGKRAEVTANIGKPYLPFNGREKGRPSKEELEEIGHDMMRRIAALIPPEKRGYYSDDPAIREAAKGTEIYPWENVSEV